MNAVFIKPGFVGLPLGYWASEGKVSACNVGDPGLIPGLGRSPGEGNGDPLWYFCLENPMDGEACRLQYIVGYSLWGLKESDLTEWLHFHFLSLGYYTYRMKVLHFHSRSILLKDLGRQHFHTKTAMYFGINSYDVLKQKILRQEAFYFLLWVFRLLLFLPCWKGGTFRCIMLMGRKSTVL